MDTKIIRFTHTDEDYMRVISSAIETIKGKEYTYEYYAEEGHSIISVTINSAYFNYKAEKSMIVVLGYKDEGDTIKIICTIIMSPYSVFNEMKKDENFDFVEFWKHPLRDNKIIIKAIDRCVYDRIEYLKDAFYNIEIEGDD